MINLGGRRKIQCSHDEDKMKFHSSDNYYGHKYY